MCGGWRLTGKRPSRVKDTVPGLFDNGKENLNQIARFI
jgi:hypothetical protein